MSVHLLGVPRFEDALDISVRAMLLATNAAVANGAHLIEARTKQKLTTYSHKKNTPTPSPPGQPPALVRGRLRASVKTRITERATGVSGVASATVGPTAVYGRIQELGGRCGRGHATELPARPYLAPTVRALESSGELRRAFEEAWLRAVEGMGEI